VKAITKHDFTERICEEMLGWKWMSFVGTPVRGTDGYPAKCRVRQFLSPKSLKSAGWQEYLAENDGREATGDEPLAYCYCSSCGPECPPRIILLIEES